jgi:hypothetical protein
MSKDEMTDAQDLPAALLDLAARCEAGEPSPLLDVAIARAIGWTTAQFGALIWRDTHHNDRGIAPPKFTSSLDAAVTLVPEGWHTSLVMQHMLRRESAWECALRRDRNGDCEQGFAKTEILSRVAAALRAKAAMLREGK